MIGPQRVPGPRGIPMSPAMGFPAGRAAAAAGRG